MLATDEFQRFVVERLRIDGYSGNSVLFKKIENGRRNGIRSARLHSELVDVVMTLGKDFVEHGKRKRGRSSAADINGTHVNTVFFHVAANRAEFFDKTVRIRTKQFFLSVNRQRNERTIRAFSGTERNEHENVAVALRPVAQVFLRVDGAFYELHLRRRHRKIF